MKPLYEGKKMKIESMKAMIAKLLKDSRRLQELEPNTETESRIKNAVTLINLSTQQYRISLSHNGQGLCKRIVAGYSTEIKNSKHGARLFRGEMFDVTNDALQSVADRLAFLGNSTEWIDSSGRKMKLTLTIEPDA